MNPTPGRLVVHKGPAEGSRRWLGPVLVALAMTTVGCAAGASTSGSAASTPVPTSSAPASAGPTTTVPPTTVPIATAPTTTVPATTAPPTTVAQTTTTAPPVTAPPITTPAQAGAPQGLGLEEGDLKPGSRGLRTFAIQKALKALQFDPGEPDGSFGLKTSMAIWAYQAIYGLPVTGQVIPIVEASILLVQPPQMMRPDLGPNHTEVDLDKQVLLVFRDGQLRLATHVSTGSGRHYCNQGRCGNALTPIGDYRYQRRISGWREAPLGRLYNPIYFNGGIAVHGAPSVPNHPASHGCVRIPMHIAEYFPGLVNIGDPVSVFRGGQGGAAPTPVPPPAENQPPPPAALVGD